MSCQGCGADRIASINAKSSDLNCVEIDGIEHDGYVPDDIGIGGGDYVEFTWCLHCGKIQGDFPVPTPEKFIPEPQEKIDMDDLFDGD